jgi:hypothetical protein
MDDCGQFGCVIWDLAQLTLVIAICGVQHRLIGDLHGAVSRDNLDENGASIWVRRGSRAEG